MQVKLFELRDEGTFILAFAFEIEAANPAQGYLIRRCGYDTSLSSPRSIMFGYLNGERPASADPFFWQNRTMAVAHAYIYENFSSLADGAVIDVQFILGETSVPKSSERNLDNFA